MGLHSVGPNATAVQDQLDRNLDSITTLEQEITSLSSQLRTMSDQQQEIIELYEGIKVLIKVFAGIEKAAVWVTKIAAATVILWVMWKFTVLHTITDIFKEK